jgi:hypothetical protein
MGNWATIKNKQTQERKKIIMRRKWPVVHYLKIVTATRDAVLIDFGLMEDVWLPKKTMFELNEERKRFQTSRKLLEAKGVDVNAIEVLSPEKLQIRKNALMFLEWKHRND